LGDDNKRKQYDLGGFDPNGGDFDMGGFGNGGNFTFSSGGIDPNDIFRSFFS